MPEFVELAESFNAELHGYVRTPNKAAWHLHAQAQRVGLEVRADGTHMQIKITDDGQGFDPGDAFSQNRGLSGMRERASLLGGLLHVNSRAGQGTELEIILPLKEQTA